MTLSPASSLARTATPEARATARLGAATRKLRPARIGVGRDARVSRPARNTCPTGNHEVVCQERGDRGQWRDVDGEFDRHEPPGECAPLKTEDAEASADISRASHGREGSERGVL